MFTYLFYDLGSNRKSKAELLKEGIFYLIHLFAIDILLMLETEETKTI